MAKISNLGFNILQRTLPNARGKKNTWWSDEAKTELNYRLQKVRLAQTYCNTDYSHLKGPAKGWKSFIEVVVGGHAQL